RFIALKKWRHKFVNWAEEYIKLMWPPTTPDYLYSEAFATVISRDLDLEKQALALLADQSRIRLLRCKHGNDYQSFMQLQAYIDILAERINAVPSNRLTHLATALHFHSQLSQRTRKIPVELPAIFALLDNSEYAIT